ncbi:3-oxoadipate enol-lactonase [Paradevosia shaoguanensis]|uniref:3-oxoadipate enol-lactonase n=1 Tax=Paradevosia shaoguanensis TaxID=1335043 RepID=A0AA41QNA0_9HYPH|nr:3-oxoadipate enol-lactonase [Paradevosia shaoguanensis]MCF1742471.1 3-oxoadipate enol-lactonase [Paradevosia shaoguanensis]MCI0126954.1 3-oxoadipate enol-lactonase [Paradevosia shaoguanensis]
MIFARINGINMHLRVSGAADSRVVVLSNSLGTDARIWDAVIERLSDRYRVISYDQRGHGLSDAPSAPYKLDDHVADLEGLADLLGLAEFALAGVSVGGLIAQGFALRNAHRLKALILCDTAARIGDDATWNSRIAAIRANGIGSISDAIMARWFGPQFRAEHAADYAGWRNMLERSPVEGYIGTCAALRDADLRGQVGSIGLRTLVVVGEHDQSTPPEVVRATAQLLPDAQFEIMAGVGHIPSIEQPERLVELMLNYFHEVGYV